MVVKMMKWSPWPPVTKQFQVKVKVLRLEGIRGGGDEEKGGPKITKKIAVELRWKGPKGGLVSLRRRERRNLSEEGRFVGYEMDAVEFGDEFENVCGFSASAAQKENSFNPWDVSFSILYGDGCTEQQQRRKLAGAGSVSLNLGELASLLQKGETESQLFQRQLSFPLHIDGVITEAALFISVCFVEIRTSPEESPEEAVEEPNQSSDSNNSMPDSFLRRMTSYVSPHGRSQKKKKMTMVGPDPHHPGETEGLPSSRFSPGDTTDDSIAAFDSEAAADEAGQDPPEQLGYDSIASAAMAAAAENESAVYYSRGNGGEEDGRVTRSESVMSSEAMSGSPPKSSRFLLWKKRRLNLRSATRKDEPLLKKANGEDGGDDIDFVRRQLRPTSDDSSSSSKRLEGKLVQSNFEGEDFAVGSWEEKELVSRDGQSKMKAKVFFASIDQRSESAAGESACTALVAVIADWLQTNQGAMPTRSEFDSLIRDGSSEWRKLCDDETYRDKYPDKHFDLDTVIEAGIRPISVIPEKSFIGFFHPENFEFLQGAMSFDNIWDEISSQLEDGREHAYIVSWNDHFFVLKVDGSAYYIIDTLGERLFEGCNQAFILKFDDTTSMSEVLENAAGDEKDGNRKEETKATAGRVEEGSNPGSAGDDDGAVLCSGRECCREFIKRFLAAIPLRELEAEAKKGALPGVSLHQRLQIELHYSTASAPSSCPSTRTTVSMFEANDALAMREFV